MRRTDPPREAASPEENGAEGEEDQGSLVADEPAPEARLEREQERRRRPTLVLAVLALGVVYGDIGTSPIYAFRESLLGRNPLPRDPGNVFGILSLVFWSLMVVVTFKYLFYILRAENDGEGGILALAALLEPWTKGRRTAVFLGLFGSALLFSDGMITPAISVLSAVEGLEVAVPSLGRFVVPIAIAVLLLLFLFQRRGTAGIGSVFGPVMAVWFVVLAVLGIGGIAGHPRILEAVNPAYAVRFFAANGGRGFLTLGAVFLVVTGGEALYADLGHFGARPIRVGWFALVLPCLLLNYFGQGALLLSGADAVRQPFYRLAPGWALTPLVALTTVATVIASQAVISGVFSLSRQAVHLGQFPHLRVEQTSEEDVGRIYVPALNWVMMAAAIGLVLGFRTSSALAGAYGVAVSTTFVITTLLALRVSLDNWRWRPAVAIPITAGLLAVDLAFFGANLFKIADGGWLPLLVAALVWWLMATWAKGRRLLRGRLRELARPVEELLEELEREPPPRVPGTAVFLGPENKGIPPGLFHHLQLTRSLHETVLILMIRVSSVPRVPFRDRLEVAELGAGIYRAVAHYGFMQTPRVPVLLEACRRGDVPLAGEEDTTFYVGRWTPVAIREVGMSFWRARVYQLLARNESYADESYGIPFDRTVEAGIRLEV